MTEPGKQYLLVFRSSSGARIPAGHHIDLRDLPGDTGPTQVRILTRYEETELNYPMPRELIFETRLVAESIDDAITVAAAMANTIAVMLSFATNASIDSPRLQIGLDATPDIDRREFIQSFIIDETGPLRVGRFVRGSDFIAVVRASIDTPHRERIARAMSQYEAALRNWNPGRLLMVVEHAYMGAEALANVVEKQKRAALEVTKDEHALLLGVDTTRRNWQRELLIRVRREYIFQGDNDSYDAVSRASEGFEHGFTDIGSLRGAANGIAAKVLGYLREAIMKALEVPEPDHSNLLSRHPVDVSQLRTDIRGHLSGNVLDAKALAREDLLYPQLHWVQSISALDFIDDALVANVDQTISHAFAEGVQFDADESTTYSGMNPADSIKPTENGDGDEASG